MSPGEAGGSPPSPGNDGPPGTGDDDAAGAARIPVSWTVVLGLVVICGFGSWFYGFGVLLEPITRDTGWSEALLSAGYGVGALGAGFGAVVAGRYLDRFGPRPVYLVGAVACAAGAALTASAQNVWVFLACAVVTQCVTGAVGHYSAVHATITKLRPRVRARGIMVNTLWGAFASPVFLPLIAWVAAELGWRAGLAISSGLAALTFAVAGIVLPIRRGTHRPGNLLSDLAAALRDPVTRRLLVAAVCGSAAIGALILYQVPAMVSAGLGLGAASALAGARGVFQLAGRLPIPWLLPRVGAHRLLRSSFVGIGVSLPLLLASGNLVVAAVFAVVAGIAVGMKTTMLSIYAADLTDPVRIGLVMGAVGLANGVGQAVGPAAAGLLTELTGGRDVALWVMAAVVLVGTFLIPAPPPSPPQVTSTPEP